MRKNNLIPNNGLSLSQAQSISNLCNQRALDIEEQLTNVNNCSKTINYDGDTKTIESGKSLPVNVVGLLMEKAKLHACQAFLMENIKAKEIMLKSARFERADITEIDVPHKPVFNDVTSVLLEEVNEMWGWEQLKASEINEYYEAEAFAAHIGQFIHKNGTLTKLRKELPHLPELDWMSIKDGEKTPVDIKKHHNSSDLLKLHEELAGIHREYEQRVNYFKAKVKNLTTAENARIAKINADIQNKAIKINNDSQAEYETEMKRYNQAVEKLNAEFEEIRQAKIAEIVTLRINVDARFQETINMFLPKVEK